MAVFFFFFMKIIKVSIYTKFNGFSNLNGIETIYNTSIIMLNVFAVLFSLLFLQAKQCNILSSVA